MQLKHYGVQDVEIQKSINELAEQVEHGDRNAAGIRRTQAEGAIDIHDPERLFITLFLLSGP